MTEEQAKKTIGKNVITRSVGFEREVAADILEREVSSGDTFIFCSDGLSGMLTDQLIALILNDNPMDKVTPILIQQALAHGGDDNVTALVLNFQY